MNTVHSKPVRGITEYNKHRYLWSTDNERMEPLHDIYPGFTVTRRPSKEREC
jgi:hypothetical protein